VTGRLHLRLDKWLDGDQLDHGVVANCYAAPSTEDDPTHGKDRRGLVIPAGHGGRAEFELEPGRYLVEAVLPSGEIVSDQVAIAAGRDVELDLHSAKSPHEWLSWHQFLGNVGSAEGYPPEAGVAAAQPVPRQFWIKAPVASLRGDPRNGAAAWSGLGTAFDVGAAASALGAGQPEQIEPRNYDDVVELYELEGRRPREYLIVETILGTDVVSVPVPWSDVVTGRHVKAQVLVRRDAREGEAATAVSVRDPALGSALGYMTGGNLPAAAQVFDLARDMLYRKMENPLAAAAGGYVLLGTETGAERKDWHRWIRNLYTRFEWLSDGAIQHGWLKLRHRHSRRDLKDARDAMVTAYNRGLPFYSVGLQWLVEGLTLFAGDDHAIAEMLQNVRRVAWRTNMQQAFTIVQLHRR
jgi:hypothetical protein